MRNQKNSSKNKAFQDAPSFFLFWKSKRKLLQNTKNHECNQVLVFCKRKSQKIVLNDILQANVVKSELKTQSLKPQGLSTSLGQKKALLMKRAFLLYC